MNLKTEAARIALQEVRSGMRLGLGTGSTASEFVRLLGESLREGTLRDIRCTCTSEKTEAQARAEAIPTFPLAEVAPLDLAVDGTDEIDAHLRLIKGRGGALLREKIVEQQAKRFIVIADVEDGVLPAEKPRAREMVAATLDRPWNGRPRRYVRLNARTTPWFDEDLNAIVRPGLEGVCMTKVNSVDELRDGIDALAKKEIGAGLAAGSVRVVAAIESARGLLAAPQIAAADERVIALIFGAEDYALDLGLPAARVAEAAELLYPRSAIIVAATAAGVLSIDGVFPDLDNEPGCVADIWQARRLGFTSKSTFNPRQVDLINDIFSPQSDEIAYARTLAAAFDEASARGDASVAVGGQLVDLPILMRAVRILESIGERAS